MFKCQTSLPYTRTKGSKHDLESDRGIFGLSVFQKIIDGLIYKEKYPLVDDGMTDSNIGARKKKNIQKPFIHNLWSHKFCLEGRKCMH